MNPRDEPHRYTDANGRRLPVGAGAEKRPFADMRGISIVCFRRTLGTAAPGHKPPVEVTFQIVP
jgi:hypothetical protein